MVIMSKCYICMFKSSLNEGLIYMPAKLSQTLNFKKKERRVIIRGKQELLIKLPFGNLEMYPGHKRSMQHFISAMKDT